MGPHSRLLEWVLPPVLVRVKTRWALQRADPAPWSYVFSSPRLSQPVREHFRSGSENVVLAFLIHLPSIATELQPPLPRTSPGPPQKPSGPSFTSTCAPVRHACGVRIRPPLPATLPCSSPHSSPVSRPAGCPQRLFLHPGNKTRGGAALCPPGRAASTTPVIRSPSRPARPQEGRALGGEAKCHYAILTVLDINLKHPAPADRCP